MQTMRKCYQLIRPPVRMVLFKRETVSHAVLFRIVLERMLTYVLRPTLTAGLGADIRAYVEKMAR